MLKLDPYSESVLYQCEGCRRVGELFSQVVEDEGTYLCWNCLVEARRSAREASGHAFE